MVMDLVYQPHPKTLFEKEHEVLNRKKHWWGEGALKTAWIEVLQQQTVWGKCDFWTSKCVKIFRHTPRIKLWTWKWAWYDAFKTNPVLASSHFHPPLPLSLSLSLLRHIYVSVSWPPFPVTDAGWPRQSDSPSLCSRQENSRSAPWERLSSSFILCDPLIWQRLCQNFHKLSASLCWATRANIRA